MFDSALAVSPTPVSHLERAQFLHHAALGLSQVLERGEALTAPVLRQAMTEAFGGDDTQGQWIWKEAYEAGEAAAVLFLNRFGLGMKEHAATSSRPEAAALVSMIEQLATLLPSQTRRSEDQLRFQQFSTPLPLALIAAQAGAITPQDTLLEPSAGTGLLAVMGRLYSPAGLILNEIAPLRAELLTCLFPQTKITRHNAEHIDDLLDDCHRPGVIVMNPPFSASPHIEATRRDVFERHLRSAFDRLRPRGRLVAIGPESISPYQPGRAAFFRSLQDDGTIIASQAINGRLYARHGTNIATRLSVIDKQPAQDPGRFPTPQPPAQSWGELLDYLNLPPRLVSGPPKDQGVLALVHSRPATPVEAKDLPRPSNETGEDSRPDWADPQPLAYRIIGQETISSDNPAPEPAEDTGCYRDYACERIVIDGAAAHPAALMQSTAMASVLPPVPDYRPLLPRTIIEQGLLSQAQLESLIYAGQAHAQHIPGQFRIDARWEMAIPLKEGDDTSSADEDADDSSFTAGLRRGWFLGDGTGAGKGRQAAGIILDNWLQGRRRALWLSKSDKLIEDARRDWMALGGNKEDVLALSSYRPGADIPLSAGILFTTYSTLRREDRLRQVVTWLAGNDALSSRLSFEGVIVFDEAHAMANAAGGKGEGMQRAIKPSAQGLAGLRLQNALPDARVVYISATGATAVRNLAYTSRLGLWGAADMPFMMRDEFIAAMEKGGVAAMEAVAHDLKALGLYTARCLSYTGVETAILEHPLTPNQRDIYDRYAKAFKIIHSNIRDALEETGITGDQKTLNSNAKAAALSAFEGAKQRFFGHLLTAMKCPTLIKSIEADLAAGHAPVIQLISTGEALQERRLAEIPPSEWNDLSIDLTPREYVLGYLERAFPVILHERYSDEEGHIHSRPVLDHTRQPVVSKKALARRDALIEDLAALPPIPCALDQIIRHFGHKRVAEVTGRSRRIILEEQRLKVQKRPASANLAEAQAFMQGNRDILIFSEAGGTGRSYHADNAAANRKRRVHYLLEPGWRADIAIQGLGRTHRTNQDSAPVFRPVCTDVKGERRFISTIARRLDTLGAITRGERRSQGQGLFKPEDNLESPYAKAALRQLYTALQTGQIKDWTEHRFHEATGLKLSYEGSLKDQLPPMSQFLNRLLALPIAEQNQLFGELETRIATKIEQAIEGGTFDLGIETLRADSFTLKDSLTVFTHQRSGAQTRLLTITRRDRLKPLSAEIARAKARQHGDQGRIVINHRSKRAAVIIPAPVLSDEDGDLIERCRLIRPSESTILTQKSLSGSHWQTATPSAWQAGWDAEIATLPSHQESQLYIVTGLLLPIWDRCPQETAQIRRLTTDDGKTFLGRLLNNEQANVLYRNCGLTPKTQSQPPGKLAERVLHEGVQLTLANNLTIRRRRIMGLARMEIEAPVDQGLDRGTLNTLKRTGCTVEIIQFKTRAFVPEDPDAPVLARILERWPIVDTAA